MQPQGMSWRGMPGAGAAGGMGFATLTVGGILHSGAETVAQWCRLEEHVSDVDWVITGEGRIDQQTAEGKVVSCVMNYAQKYRKPVVALVGIRGPCVSVLHHRGLTFIMSIVSEPMTLDQALQKKPSSCCKRHRKK